MLMDQILSDLTPTFSPDRWRPHRTVLFQPLGLENVVAIAALRSTIDPDLGLLLAPTSVLISSFRSTVRIINQIPPGPPASRARIEFEGAGMIADVANLLTDWARLDWDELGVDEGDPDVLVAAGTPSSASSSSLSAILTVDTRLSCVRMIARQFWDADGCQWAYPTRDRLQRCRITETTKHRRLLEAMVPPFGPIPDDEESVLRFVPYSSCAAAIAIQTIHAGAVPATVS